MTALIEQKDFIMSDEDVQQLQREIDKVISHTPKLKGTNIVLDQGSDVTDLSANVDVIVSRCNVRKRLFSIVTAVHLHDMLGDSQHKPAVSDEWGWPAEWRGLHSTGGPLIVVREITADVIVRAVNRYLDQETWRLQYPY